MVIVVRFLAMLSEDGWKAGDGQNQPEGRDAHIWAQMTTKGTSFHSSLVRGTVCALMSFDRGRMQEQAASLAVQGVYLGTPSWKHEGWLGQLHTGQRYAPCTEGGSLVLIEGC
jgi:hypothetical protein